MSEDTAKPTEEQPKENPAFAAFKAPRPTPPVPPSREEFDALVERVAALEAK